jgi:hypothetical protein
MSWRRYDGLRFTATITLAALVLLTSSCSPKKSEEKVADTKTTEESAELSLPDNSSRVTITQGLWGDVLFYEGEFGGDDPDGKIEPIVRTIYIYEPTHNKRVTWQNSEFGAFAGSIATRLIDSTTSDETGFYQIALPPGKFSLFVREEYGLYAPHLNLSTGELGTVQVYPERLTRFNIRINYAARY